MSLIPKNRQIYSENLLIPSFYFKEQLPKRKFENMLCLTHCFIMPAKWENCFLIWSMEKQNFLRFSSILFFKTVKEDIPPWRRLQKGLLKFSFAHFRELIKIFWGPAPSWKATFQSDILELGSNNNLAPLAECPLFSFFQKSLHPTVYGGCSDQRPRGQTECYCKSRLDPDSDLLFSFLSQNQ